MGTRLLVTGVLGVLNLGACERKPIFQEPVPPNQLGGFLVACASVTDTSHRIGPCAAPFYRFHNNDGGCACAQGLDTPNPAPLVLPPAIPGFAMGALTFRDTACVASYVSACLPRVIPTVGGWDESNLPDGQLSLVRLFKTKPDAMMWPPQRGDGDNTLPGSMSTFHHDPDFRNAYSDINLDDLYLSDKFGDLDTDIHNVTKSACNLAHWAAIQYYVYGFAPGSPDWVSAMNRIGGAHSQWTTALDGYDLQHFDYGQNPPSWVFGSGWGLIDPPVPIEPRDYVGHPFPPSPTICHPNLTYPSLGLGYPTILDLGNGGAPHVSHPPQRQQSLRPQQHRIVIDSRSAALLTVGTLDPVAIAFNGGLDVDVSDCSAGGCVARLRALTLAAAPFRIGGYEVSVLRVNAADPAQGVLSGDLLTFTSFSAVAEVKLADGRYDYIQISTGVLLARWDVARDSIVVAVSFSATIDDTDVNFSGTAFGRFNNISPTAMITLSYPLDAQRMGNSATVECQSPVGTDVILSGSTSSDREDDVPQLVWYDSSFERIGESSELSLPRLGLGTYDVQLMAHDKDGFADSDSLTLNIIDSLPPDIVAPDICVYPPNHSNVSVRLDSELIAVANDRCEGMLSSAVTITGVSSSSGAGVLSWGSSGACLTIERRGTTKNGQIYDIELTASDSAGNTSSKTLHVQVPHNGPTRNCLRVQDLNQCQ